MDIPVEVDQQKADRLHGQIIVIKCGGNAMVDDRVKHNIIDDIISLKEAGAVPVVVHGGGPMIQKLLDDVGIQSEFIDGHRKTDAQTMGYVEMALTGSVNSELVSLLSDKGYKAVGISGKDGKLATARKRMHEVKVNGKKQQTDLGHVGDIESIDTSLVQLLIDNDYIPVVSPVAGGEELNAFNVNADMFAGHLAGALGAASYVALTNVDGLQLDPNDPSTLIHEITVSQARSQIGQGIKGGMIPKVESCIIALEEGARSARIVNGMKEHTMLQALLTPETVGTLLRDTATEE